MHLTPVTAHLICLGLVVADLVARTYRLQWLAFGVGSRLTFSESLRINAFDIQSAAYTGEQWLYKLDPQGTNIGDMTAVNGRKRSIIERTYGRTRGLVSSTGIEPLALASSKRSRTVCMKTCSCEGAIASCRSSP